METISTNSSTTSNRRNRSKSKRPFRGAAWKQSRSRSNSRSASCGTGALVVPPTCDIKDPRLSRMNYLTYILSYQACLLSTLVASSLFYNDWTSKSVQLAAFVFVENVVTFLVYGVDKGHAENQRWRVPETTLHLLCLMFGCGGALGAMKVFRHKTCKTNFVWTTMMCAAVSLIFYMALFYFIFVVIP